MSSSADNDITSLNFCYRNAENKNIIFALEVSKDKKVSDLEKEVICRLLMFDIPLPSHNSKDFSNAIEMLLMIDCTASLENSSIRTQDNFVLTSFVEPMRVNYQTPYTKNQQATNKRIYNDIVMSHEDTIESNTDNVIIDESYHKFQKNDSENTKISKRVHFISTG